MRTYAGLKLRAHGISNAVELALLAEGMYELVNGSALGLVQGKLRGLWLLLRAVHSVALEGAFAAYVGHSERCVRTCRGGWLEGELE